MTNPTTTALRARALAALVVAPARDTAAQRHNAFATIAVTLPDGSTGVATALDLAAATYGHGIGADDCHVSVRQGQRVDLWHVSQLS